MDEKELRAILNSDFKLWNAADTVEEGNVVTKTIELPYGIGPFTLSFEGAADAKGRRNATSIFGQSVRDAVEERISEESITARAAQKAAMASEDSGGGDSGDGGDTPGSGDVSTQEAVSAFGTATTFDTDPARRLHELRELAAKHSLESKRLLTEAKALEAYLEIIKNAGSTEGKTSQETDG